MARVKVMGRIRSRTAPARPAPRAVRNQAEIFSHTRKEHAHEIAEDYVEAIADLAIESGEARVVDLAARLGVTHVTVNRTIARLQDAGLVITQPYRPVVLTEKGKALAVRCRARHQVVVAFLRSVGVSEHIAERDAEGIEHHVSPETLAAFRAALGLPES